MLLRLVLYSMNKSNIEDNDNMLFMNAWRRRVSCLRHKNFKSGASLVAQVTPANNGAMVYFEVKVTSI